MGMAALHGNRRLPTRLEHARRLYVNGTIDLEEFERRADALVRAGAEDQPDIIDRGPSGFRDPATMSPSIGKRENR